MGQEVTSGQCQLPLSVASYSTAFNAMLHAITIPIDFILWHATLVTFNTFLHMSLILYEFGAPLWTMKRETWRKLKKASSLLGAVLLAITIRTSRVWEVMTFFDQCL